MLLFDNVQSYKPRRGLDFSACLHDATKWLLVFQVNASSATGEARDRSMEPRRWKVVVKEAETSIVVLLHVEILGIGKRRHRYLLVNEWLERRRSKRTQAASPSKRNFKLIKDSEGRDFEKVLRNAYERKSTYT
jgi:hypothetical protein